MKTNPMSYLFSREIICRNYLESEYRFNKNAVSAQLCRLKWHIAGKSKVQNLLRSLVAWEVEIPKIQTPSEIWKK